MIDFRMPKISTFFTLHFLCDRIEFVKRIFILMVASLVLGGINYITLIYALPNAQSVLTIIIFAILYGVLGFPLVIAFWATIVQRLRDIGLNWWGILASIFIGLVLINFVPEAVQAVLGALYFLTLLVVPSMFLKM